jgi:hypothetical protein
MKKIGFLIIICNISVFAYSQNLDMVRRLWGNSNKPIINELNYIERNDNLIITCGDGKEILIQTYDLNSPYDTDFKQLIEVKRDGNLLYNFFSDFIILPSYFSGIYQIQLTPNSQAVLLVSYIVGTSGIGANMTFGILFDINNCNYQYLGTWGLVNERFVDIDGDGIFEFVSIDISADFNSIDLNRKLIANIFKPDNFGNYVINNSLKENNVFVLFFDDLRIDQLDVKQSEIKLMKVPNPFDENNY